MDSNTNHDQTGPQWWLHSFLSLKPEGYLPYLASSLSLYLVPVLIQIVHSIFSWISARFFPTISVTGRFDEEDPAYKWILFLLIAQTNATEFSVSGRGIDSRCKGYVNSRRKREVKNGSAEYTPMYDTPSIFYWRGHLVEIKRNRNEVPRTGSRSSSNLQLTIFTRDTSLLYELVNEAHDQFVEVNKPYVMVYLADVPNYIPANPWTNIVRKVPRPLSSVILPDGVTNKLVADVQEFLNDQDSYVQRGIPYRRGYLLSGPPGTGKTSTVFALASELQLEIYVLSLGSRLMDDTFLQRAASSIPSHAILLIEDIDCAFKNRDNEDEENGSSDGITMSRPGSIRGSPEGERRSFITLSGLLNVIDGVASEEGRLLFATTNHWDRLDPALSRPGRIDVHVEYELSTADQAGALFMCFFQKFERSSVPASSAQPTPPSEKSMATLADAFARAIPAKEFSTAELQGYLQLHKTSPHEAACRAGAWVERVRADRHARAERKAERRRRTEERYTKKVPQEISSSGFSWFDLIKKVGLA
ncbi:P-loop containing nucleoside triphosphate hydrolase protein [Mycena capillaripes]|nr:P-loop containing nucleoside triphosphate hydrolase protein [Mycena capillaripes]